MAHNSESGGELYFVQWSIIIPALNEEEHIQECLDSVVCLAGGGHTTEVIVVDNGSTDRTVSIAESYSDRLAVRVLQRPGIKIGAVRNAGAAVARGRWLVFLDADCLFNPQWLSHASPIVNAHPSAVVGSYYALSGNAGWPAQVWHQRFHAGRRGEVTYLPGGNLVMERYLFWKIGGFDSDLRSNEDSQFCSRAKAASIPVLAFPELAVTHLGAEKNLQQFVKRQMWHGSNVLNQLGMRGNVRALGFAAYTLLGVIFVLATLLARHLEVSAIVTGLLSLPPAVVSLRGGRLRGRLKNVPLLFVLLSVYALVRACMLPIALFHGLRKQAVVSTASQSG